MHIIVLFYIESKMTIAAVADNGVQQGTDDDVREVSAWIIRKKGVLRFKVGKFDGGHVIGQYVETRTAKDLEAYTKNGKLVTELLVHGSGRKNWVMFTQEGHKGELTTEQRYRNWIGKMKQVMEQGGEPEQPPASICVDQLTIQPR